MKTKAAILDEMKRRRAELPRYTLSYQEYLDACVDIAFDVAAEVLATVATHETNGKHGNDDDDRNSDG